MPAFSLCCSWQPFPDVGWKVVFSDSNGIGVYQGSYWNPHNDPDCRVPHRCAIMIRREFERRWRVATAKVLLGITPFDHLVIHKIVNYGA